MKQVKTPELFRATHSAIFFGSPAAAQVAFANLENLSDITTDGTDLYFNDYYLDYFKKYTVGGTVAAFVGTTAPTNKRFFYLTKPGTVTKKVITSSNDMTNWYLHIQP